MGMSGGGGGRGGEVVVGESRSPGVDRSLTTSP